MSRFWGLTAFHDLEEICCVDKFEKNEQYRNELIEVLNEIFEMERKDVPSFGNPRITFFDSMDGLEARMRA